MVADLMTRPVVTIPETARFKHVVAALNGHGVGSLPVLDQDGRPAGVVSEADLLGKLDRDGAGRPPLLPGKRWQRWKKARATNAGDVMTRSLRTITADATVADAARELLHGKLRRLYVVDAQGRLVGVLARRDLLRVFLRPDQELHTQVELEVRQRCLWAAPDEVSVRVRDGEVTLAGRVGLRSEARRAVALTEAIPGVVAVYDELQHDVDDTVPA